MFIAIKRKTLVTENGPDITDRAFGRREKDARGNHEFHALCRALGIEHRLTKPQHPQTNGMVERFNGRLAQVPKSHRLNSAHDLETTLHRFVWLYNEHLPQRALDLSTPIQELKIWQATQPDLFDKRVVNHPGPDVSATSKASHKRRQFATSPLATHDCGGSTSHVMSYAMR